MKCVGAILNCIALAAVYSVLLCNTVRSQDEVLRVDTSLVTIPATVMDRDGRYIADLDKGDFAVFENGVEQEIALFETIDSPFTAMLLLDLSGSMRSHMGGLARAANAFVTQMRPDDTIIVATFADSRKINIVVEATRKRDFKQTVWVNPLKDFGFTVTFDAVEAAITNLAGRRGRKAIVLFTDGELYGEKASLKGTLKLAEEQEAMIYTVRFGQFPTVEPGSSNLVVTEKDKRRRAERSDAYLQGLSRRSGGRSYQIDRIDDLSSVFKSISNELGRQYFLAYYPQDGGAPRTREIQVKIVRPDLLVRTREVYSRGKSGQVLIFRK